ncbi:MAG: hypothetical protein ACQUHE_09555 [Bacteroidia bacterium]
MKSLFTLVFVCSILSASAQVTASIVNKDKNPVCMERGHNVTPIKSTAGRLPYTIDTKDSTVTVYPANTMGRCTRCAAEIASTEKDIRVTTWRRVEKPANVVDFDTTDWGNNARRGLNLKLNTSNLNDIKKIATLRNDTLFIHKRVAPFKSIKEQVEKTTVIYYKNKPISFKAAVYDEATFYTGKGGLEIF